MRFIGNKTKLLVYINDILGRHNVLKGDRFFDFFAGTASVGKFFKEQGYHVSSSDILYFSYVLQEAYIANTGEPSFEKLIEKLKLGKSLRLVASNYELILDYLNDLKGVKGFIYENYTDEGTKDKEQHRKFFKPENGMKIDAVRSKVEEWRLNNLINHHEYFVLVATIIETVPYYANISGVYAAFLKTYDPRAVKDLVLRPIDLSSKGLEGTATNADSMSLIDKIDTDILYLDPPYNARQYAPNYHLLETIALYDNPEIKGVAGIRPYQDLKSEFCNPVTALAALKRVAGTAKYKYLVLSYNSEGIMDQEDIKEALSSFGDVKLYEVDYRRFKSNSNGEAKHKTHIQEQLYVLQRR